MHGRGVCKQGAPEQINCDGFLCYCEYRGFDGPEVFEVNHGHEETNPCNNAVCSHCGWSGRYPADGLDIFTGAVDLEESPVGKGESPGFTRQLDKAIEKLGEALTVFTESLDEQEQASEQQGNAPQADSSVEGGPGNGDEE